MIVFEKTWIAVVRLRVAGIAVLFSSLTLSGCKEGTSDFSNILDSPDLSKCAISAKTPSANSVKVSSGVGISTSFGVTITGSSCNTKFILNGVALSGSDAVRSINSSDLNSGNNTLKVQVSNALGTVEQEWTVIKNLPPTCSLQNPASSGNSVSIPNSLNLTATASNSDSDTLSYTWKINGLAPATGVLSSIDGLVQSQGTFTPDSSYIGSNNVTVDISDGYDTATCSWSVQVAGTCAITSSSPSTTTARIAFAPTTASTFQVNTSGAGCTVSWALNGTNLAGTGSIKNFVSSDFLNGANVLVATVTNGSTNISRTWTVMKNTPPTCSSQTPSSTGNTTGVSQGITFTANGADSESDPLTFGWKMNGSSSYSSAFNVSNGTNSSSAIYTPTGGMVGNNTISADINDGYDTVACSWSVSVTNNCSVSSSFPSGSSVRIANSGSTSNLFTSVPSDAGCTVTWKLNSVAVGSAGPTQTLTSSQFNIGSNTLEATLSNGSSTVTRTWTVVKNSVPACASQTPASSGNSVATGNNITFTANGSDGDSDSLFFNWKSNGSSVNSSYFAVTTGVGTSQAIFSPNSSYVGANTVTAEITDGYDTNTCSWAVNVLPTCTVGSSIPAGATTRVANLGTTSTSFGVVPSDGSCTISWTLNGSNLAGAGSFQSVLSSALNLGANTIVATLTNGASTVTRTWVVNKNSVPVCSGQSPSASGNTLPYTSTSNLSGSVTDSDGDTMAFTWKFNGATNGSLFASQVAGTTTASSVFTPALGQVGNGHTLALEFTDGYDVAQCSWAYDVIDPNTVQITSCQPGDNPTVVTSSGTNSTRTFTVSATGTSLTYKWKKNGTDIPGATSPTYNESSGAAETFVLTSEVRDAYSNMQSCTWNVKKNVPPSLSNLSPTNSVTRTNYGINVSLGVTATDVDSLTYVWKLDGASSPKLTSGAASSVFSPNSDSALLGSHTVRVEVSDGYESSANEWTVEVNQFSNECNILFNGPATGVGATGGKVCTLAGIPGAGEGINPTTGDSQKIRIQPAHIIDDGSGNLLFTDIHNHAVWFWNRSGSSVTKFGKSIAAGTMSAILGNGGPGANTNAVGLSNNNFKLSTPRGLAYDSPSGALYVVDNGNHRVVKIDNAGAASVAFGNGGTTSNYSTHSDILAGTAHTCQSPQDVHIVNYGTHRTLFVSCYNNHMIKKMVIDPSSHSDYLIGKVAIGRIDTAGGSSAGGDADGLVGTVPSPNPSLATAAMAPGVAAYASANGPTGLSSDSNGNLYWVEYGGRRLRMANFGGSQLNLFSSTSTSQNITITAVEPNGLTAGTGVISAGSSSDPDRLMISGPSSIRQNSCTPFRLTARNATAAAPLSSSMSFGLDETTADANGAFYSDSTCTTSITNGTISAGAAYFDFYYKKTDTVARTLVATPSSAFPSPIPSPHGYYSITPIAAATPTKLAVYPPSTYLHSECARVVVQAQNASSQAVLSGSNRTIRLYHNGTGNFFTNATCSGAPVHQVTLASTESEIAVYYARTNIALAGSTQTLLGQSANNTYTVSSSVASVAELGSAALHQPRELELYDSGGTVKGAYITNDDAHRVMYVNFDTVSANVGGITIPSGDTGTVVGNAGGGTYNGDGLAGNGTNINNPYGLAMSNLGTEIFLADTNNLRLRRLTFSDGKVTTDIGQGYSRNNVNLSSQTPATAMFFNSPTGLAVDNTSRLLYVADAGNVRIRRVDLLKGFVDTIIGTGTAGDANQENRDASLVAMRAPKGLAVHSSATNTFLLYADSQGGTGQALNCMVRALNVSGTNSPDSIFGVGGIGLGNVSTVLGAYNVATGGCNPWSTAPAGVDDAQGTTVRLYTPESILSDGTNLFVANYNDHCIIKMSASGATRPIVGLCGTVGNLDGSGTSARLRYPTGLALDPSFAAQGNFFFVDGYDQAAGNIKYANFTASTPTYLGTTVQAGTSGSPAITTLTSFGPLSTTSRLTGIAVSTAMVCISGGLVNDANTGAHNIYCYNRSDGSFSLRIGNNETSNYTKRGGMPFGTEQEGVAGASTMLYTPYNMVFDSSGNLYFTERNTGIVRMVRRWW